MSSIELDKQAMDRLINLFFKERSLWDTEHETYCHPTEMKLAYQRIANAMKIGGLDAARVSVVIKNTRMLYLKELNKIMRSADEIMMLAAAAKVHGVVKLPPPMYVPTVSWYSVMNAMLEDKTIKCKNTAAYSAATTASYKYALDTMVITLRGIVKTALNGENNTNYIERLRGQRPTGRNDGRTARWERISFCRTFC